MFSSTHQDTTFLPSQQSVKTTITSPIISKRKMFCTCIVSKRIWPQVQQQASKGRVKTGNITPCDSALSAGPSFVQHCQNRQINTNIQKQYLSGLIFSTACFILMESMDIIRHSKGLAQLGGGEQAFTFEFIFEYTVLLTPYSSITPRHLGPMNQAKSLSITMHIKSHCTGLPGNGGDRGSHILSLACREIQQLLENTKCGHFKCLLGLVHCVQTAQYTNIQRQQARRKSTGDYRASTQLAYAIEYSIETRVTATK